MVVAKKDEVSTKYIYGSVAYDLEPAIIPEIEEKVVKVRKSQAGIKLKLMGRVIVFFVLTFLLVYRFTMVMKITYDIRSSKTQIGLLNNVNENIKIELAKMNNIKYIEKVAVSRGMIVPNPNQIRYVCVNPLTLSSGKYSQSAFQMIQRLLGLIY